MRILLSNDDGYFAPGLAALAEALCEVGDVVVVAPEQNRSGASNSLTLDRPLFLKKAANGFHYVNGTPTDCVHLAVTGMLDTLPDIILLDVVMTGISGYDVCKKLKDTPLTKNIPIIGCFCFCIASIRTRSTPSYRRCQPKYFRNIRRSEDGAIK